MDKRFEKIYSENARYVYNVALGMLRNKTEAEDIMQNVFIKLFDNFSAFRGDSSIRTYLYRMTVNKCLDLFRLRKIRESKLEKIDLPEEKNHAAGNELYSLLEKLDEDLKAPVLLSEIGGFTYKEIGDILGINLGTVKSRIHRGMHKLREIAKKEALT
jgi:RNA polymerase sigma-70 factor (ECF subfamily)